MELKREELFYDIPATFTNKHMGGNQSFTLTFFNDLYTITNNKLEVSYHISLDLGNIITSLKVIAKKYDLKQMKKS